VSNRALLVKDLSKKYGERYALSHANFEVPLGTICGFVGPNGSGKTTTIRMLLGLISPSGGSGEVLDIPISEPERYLSFVGAMIEGPAFYPALTGFQNLKVLARIGGYSTDSITSLLELVGLGDRGDSKFKTYSLGMKQRLGIAAALLPNPKLLILDEPTNGLDPAGIQEVRDLLRRLADGGITVFVSSHLLSELEMISEHLVVLREGEVIFAGKTRDLLAQHQPHIRVRVVEPNGLQIVRELAESAGHSCEVRGDELYIVANESYGAEINRLAFTRGITLAEITPLRPSLEETFFEMTESDSNPESEGK
jgi:ABC-2 type transport system ATP-binding protein